MKNYCLILLTLAALCGWQCSPKKKGFTPPIPALDVPHAFYQFVAEEGALIKHPTGTQIVIQPNSLVDEDGNLVKGQVTLKYCELHGALDAFAAGAPLDYDSAGTTYQFKTAGMMDISAQQGEQALSIAPGKEIDVNFASFQAGDEFNFYYWDEQTGRWVFQKGATAAKPNPAKKRMADSLRLVRAVDPKNLMVLHFGEALDVYFNDNYQKVNDKNMQSNFRRLLATYNLTVYENLKINTPVKLGKKSYYPAYSLVWEKLEEVQPPAWLNENEGYASEGEDVDIYFNLHSKAELQKDGSYKLTIQRRKTKKVRKDVTVYDTTWQTNRRTGARRISKINPRAVSLWEYAYTDRVVNSFSFRARPYMRISEFLRRKPDQFSEEYARLTEEIDKQSRKMDEIAEVFRQVNISKFGYYNFDLIMKLPGATEIRADFRINGEQPAMVYYISTANSTKVELTKDKWDKIMLAPDPTLRIFAIMPDYSLAYYPPEEWKKLDWYSLSQKKSHTFVLKNDRSLLQTREDLKKILQM
ncbi:hypothetical protein [Rhodoflexus sp.]